jgi:hypothetical protein
MGTATQPPVRCSLGAVRCSRSSFGGSKLSVDRARPVSFEGEQRRGAVPLGRPVRHVPAAEQARRQGVRPIQTVEELIFPEVWESDEELDEFLADLYASRRADLP